MLLAAGASVVGFGCIAGHNAELASYGQNRNSGDEMTLEHTNVSLKLEKAEPDPEKPETLPVKLTLLNEGKNPVWVNKRMAVNSPNVPMAFREIWFAVEDADKKKLDFMCKIKIGFAKNEDYVTLPPGESISREFNLKQCYRLEKTVLYKIRAYYHVGDLEDHKPPEGVVPMTEVIESETIEISVG